jgi:uncharacterized integral membrane protein (TIGR00698 family)
LIPSTGPRPKLWLTEHLPGIGLCVAIFSVANALSSFAGQAISGFNPFTGSMLAIVGGILVANIFKPGPLYASGVRFCLKNVLRFAIVLIGIRLSLVEVGQLGAAGFPVVVAAVLTGVLGIELLGKVFGLPPKLAMLLGAGTSICGVTAVVSTAPVIDADEGEVAYAVANVTLFGLLGTLIYPYVVPYILPIGNQCGLFLGTAIHDMAQLMGAAATYKDLYGDEAGFATAAITKMTRNLFLALVIPYFAWRTRETRVGKDHGAKRPPLLPAFLVGFLGMSCLRTLGDSTLLSSGLALGFLSPERWTYLLHLVGKVIGSTWLVGFALVGVGLNLKTEIFKGLGLKPFGVGLLGALLVGLTSLLTIKLLFS